LDYLALLGSGGYSWFFTPAESSALLMEKPDQDAEAREMKSRLDRLSSALEAKNKSVSASSGSSDPVADGNIGRSMSLGFRVLSEFVAGIIVGCLMGWQFDEWFSTTPVFLIVFLALGTAAGFWNVYRIAMAPPTKAPSPKGRSDPKR